MPALLTMLYRWKHTAEADRHEWILKRNCALSPSQLALWFGSLAGLSLSIAGFFAWHGAWMVIPFSVLEIGALGVAFVLFARHAADYERVVATGGRLVVETSVGSRLQRIERRSPWFRVEYEGRHGDLVRVVAGGEALAVGRFVPSNCRAALAGEIRRALAGRSL